MTLQRQFSSGGVVFKKSGNQYLWLISRSTPGKDYEGPTWKLQKGWIDDEGDRPGLFARGDKKATEEVLQQAALREVREEGGVEVKIIKKITTTKFFFTTKDGEKVLKFVTYYLMEWQRDAKKGYGFETAEVRWLPHQEAKITLSISGERKILDKAKTLLDSGIQDALV